MTESNLKPCTSSSQEDHPKSDSSSCSTSTTPHHHELSNNLDNLDISSPASSDRAVFGTPASMADPFEVRMRFTHQLQHLNASVTSAQKAAQYALKYKDMDEDLHSCILEQLERNSMNNRANIMYFLEHLADMAAREGHHDYVRMMQRDILRVVDAVAPEDGSGAANGKVVRKVLQGLQAKSYLLPQTVTEIEECLKERDQIPSHIGLSSPLGAPSSSLPDAPATTGGANTNDATSIQDNNNNSILQPSSPSQQQGQNKSSISNSRPTPQKNPSISSASGTGLQNNPAFPSASALRLDKKQIEQRIEEDRERHKRLREHQWAVPFPTLPPAGSAPSIWLEQDLPDPEFDRLWEETSSVGSDDYRLFEEEYIERKKCSVEHAEEMEAQFAAAAAGGVGTGAGGGGGDRYAPHIHAHPARERGIGGGSEARA